MSNYKHEIQANSLRSNDGTDILVRDGKAAYSESYHVDDFTADQLINKQAAIEISSGVVVGAETISIPSGTAVTGGNYTIDYTSYAIHGNNPRLELDLDNGDGSFDIQFTGIKKVYTGADLTSIVLFLNSNDAGTATVSSYVLVVQ